MKIYEKGTVDGLMINWLAQNYGTIIVLAIVTIFVGALIFSLIRDKKKGKSACGCSCSSCAMCGKCHEKAEK